MKRAGKRGEGKWERISWDEALEKIISEIKRIRETHGPSSVLMLPAQGDVHILHRSPGLMTRLAQMIGFEAIGMSAAPEWEFKYSWNITSYAQGVSGSQYTYGTFHTANNRADLLNTKLMILWGWDPAGMVHGPNTTWYMAQAREAGAKIIAIDPKHSDTTATFADRWIPIKPGTDAAALIAMAYVMIDEDIYDKKFIETYTVGFDIYKDYVIGKEDGVPKTPQWAAEITGMSAEDIVWLAREYATVKPAALMAGIAPGRTDFGEQYHRAAITLACMTGNVGKSGGDAAGRAWESLWPGIIYPLHPIDDTLAKGLIGPLPEAVKKRVEAMPKRPTPTPQKPGVHLNQFPDIFNMGVFKMLFTNGAPAMNNWIGGHRLLQAIDKLEFIAAMEQFVTPLCQYADILLPATTFFERNDVAWGTGAPFVGKINKVIEPVGEARNFIDVAGEIARRMGAEDYCTKTEEQMLREFAKGAKIPDWDEFCRAGIYRYPQKDPEVCFKAQIEDPENNPFPTPSGKIEIYSETIAGWGLDTYPPIPKYIPPIEGPDNPLTEKYPFQLTTPHFKRRQLSKQDCIPWLREVQRQVVRINTKDAEERGIVHGEEVRVFNDRGQVFIPARVTERMRPGVVEIPFGCWYNPDKGGVNLLESANNLCNTHVSPCGGFGYNTALVQVEKIGTTKLEVFPEKNDTGLTIDSTIGELLADERGKAILNKHIPDLSASPNIEKIKGMTLKVIAPMSDGMITPERLDNLEKDLKKL